MKLMKKIEFITQNWIIHYRYLHKDKYIDKLIPNEKPQTWRRNIQGDLEQAENEW